MTRKEAAGVIKFEKACVLRQDTPRCNRDCKKCDLLLPTEDVLTAYEMAIKALEQEPTTKNDLGVDCISRKAAEDITWQDPSYTDPLNILTEVRDKIRELPSVTPQEPRCKECKWWKDSDGVYRRGVGAESLCPINSKEVFEGNGYCYMVEP